MALKKFSVYKEYSTCFVKQKPINEKKKRKKATQAGKKFQPATSIHPDTVKKPS
ncbi:MAG: hypothetical protein HY774_07385 [Acidobacteria bacterium]|nr:hypothetical protein [Acidobacteriota bacterium]